MPTATNKQVISAMYSAVFNRAPDAAGLGFWEAQFTAHANSVAALAAGFTQHPVFTETYGAMDNLTFIQAIYQNVLGGPGDAGGVVYWNNLISNGLSRSDMLASFVEGALTIDLPALKAAGQLTDAEFTAAVARQDQLTNKANVGLQFAAILGAKSNLDPATDTTTIAGLNADPVYLASQAAIRSVTNDDQTALDAITLLNTAAATADPIAYVNTNAPAAAGVVGTTFTLTTGVDNIVGTSGNDTIIADNTDATKLQLSTADQINGGAGTDTLKVYLAAAGTATGQPTTLTSIENVVINGGVVTAYTAATGTTGLTIEAPVLTAGALAAATYTVAGQAVTLKDANVTANSTTVIASATDTAESVTLNGWTKTGAFTNTVDFSGTKVATLNLTATGANSNVALTNSGLAVTTLNISGVKNLTVSESAAMSLAVTTIDASTATGNVSVTETALTTAGFKFTGGTGNDTITFVDDEFTTLTAGTQLNGGAGTGDKIGLFDTVVSAAEAVKINATTGFEVLGLNAAITLDASTVSNFKAFSIDTAAAQVINSLATGSTTTINVTPTSLTLGTAVGVTDHTINLGTAGIAAGTVNVSGITNLSLTSNGTAANSITLTNSDNTAVNVTGAQDLTLSLAAGTAVGSTINASTFTGKATLNGSSIIGSGDIITGGTGADTINGGKGADTLTGGAGIDKFVFTSGTAADNASGLTFGQADVITDFVVGTDKIAFVSGATVDVVSAQQVAVQAAVTALAAGSTSAQIAAAMATANTTDLGVSVATFGGNTYVLHELSGVGTGVAGNDAFVQLTGVASDFTFANSVVAA